MIKITKEDAEKEIENIMKEIKELKEMLKKNYEEEVLIKSKMN